MHSHSRIPAGLVAAAVLALGACTGTIGGETSGGGPPGPTGPTPPGPGVPGGGGVNPGMMPGAGGGGGGGGPKPALKLPGGVLRRLTAQQYASSVSDLLGPRITVPAVEADAASEDEFTLTSVAASSVVTSPRAVDQFDAAARALAQQVFADPAGRAAFAGCTPASGTDPCVRRFLTTFGRRAWRRNLTDEELGRYAAAVAATAQNSGDPWRGLEVATAALLASPHFLYRVELGVPAGGAPGTRRVLTDDELATRLSYTLWDTTPDVALLDAAGRGDLLKRPEVLRANVERLLGSPRARAPLLAFFSEWLGTAGLDKNGLIKEPTAYPAATKTLARAMYQEIEALVADLVFDARGADLLSLYDTRRTFVTAELARLYGLPDGAVPAGDRPAPVTLPDGARGGFLTSGAFLALNARASSTSPTLRGMFLRERLLCRPVPAPPDNVDTTLPPPAPGKVETMRERLTRHMADPTCAACHRVLDPPGLALENFDALGRFRATDSGRPLDVSGDLEGQPFDGPQGLAALMRASPDAAACFRRQLVQYLTGSHDHGAADSMAAELAGAWKAAGGQLRPFLVDLASGELFRTVEVAR